jgi:beta-lactamase class A
MKKNHQPILSTPLRKNKLHSQFSSFAWVVTATFVVWGLLVFKKPAETKLNPVDMESQTKWNHMVQDILLTVDSYQGNVGVYIKELKTGRTFEHNANKKFVCASLIKVPIMVAAFQAIKEGRISLGTQVRYNRKFRREGSGNLKWARSGAAYTVSYLIYNMVTRSDNTATAMVIDRLGYDYLNTRFSEFGLKETQIRPSGMSLSSWLDPTLDNYTTPQEMGSLLEKIYKHQLVGDGWSDLMLEIMKGANSRTRLGRNLPTEWKLARKTGLLRKNCHDMGIVFTPEGDYVICVLTGENRNYNVAKSLISTVGQKAFEYMRT